MKLIVENNEATLARGDDVLEPVGYEVFFHGGHWVAHRYQDNVVTLLGHRDSLMAAKAMVERDIEIRLLTMNCDGYYGIVVGVLRKDG